MKNSPALITPEQALDIYTRYLGQERIDHEGKLKKPIRSSTFKAMCHAHQPHNDNLIENYLRNNKKVYFWSDQHFNHANIIKLCDRPFLDKSHMNRTMIDNYFQTVSQDDLVIWGGDIAFGPIEEVRGFLKGLPGEKILIIGNHDFDQKEKFKDYGIFSRTYMATSFCMPIGEDTYSFIVSHYPIDNPLLPPNTLNIHGHIHAYTADEKNINISVEQTGYRPIDITAIIKEKIQTLTSSSKSGVHARK